MAHEFNSLNYQSLYSDDSLSTTSNSSEISSIYDNAIFFITKEVKKTNLKKETTMNTKENKNLVDSFFDNLELNNNEISEYSTCINFIEQYL